MTGKLLRAGARFFNSNLPSSSVRAFSSSRIEESGYSLKLSRNEIENGQLVPYPADNFHHSKRLLTQYNWQNIAWGIEGRTREYSPSYHHASIFKLVLSSGEYFTKIFMPEDKHFFFDETISHHYAAMFGLKPFILPRATYNYHEYDCAIYPLLTNFKHGDALLQSEVLLKQTSDEALIQLYLFCWLRQLRDLCKLDNIIIKDDSIVICDLENIENFQTCDTDYNRTNKSFGINYFLQCLLKKHAPSCEKLGDGLKQLGELDIPESVFIGAKNILDSLTINEYLPYSSKVFVASLQYLLKKGDQCSPTLRPFLLSKVKLDLDNVGQTVAEVHQAGLRL